MIRKGDKRTKSALRLHKDTWKTNPAQNSKRPIICEQRFKKLAASEMHQYYKWFDYLYREWLGKEVNGPHAEYAMRIISGGLSGEEVEYAVGDPLPVIEMSVAYKFGETKNPDVKVMPLGLLAETSPMGTSWEDGKMSFNWAKSELSAHPSFIFSVIELSGDESVFAKRMTFICPLKYLLNINKANPYHKEQPSLSAGCVYMHSFNDTPDPWLSDESNPLFYYGMTTRTWKARWAEHRRSIAKGSPLKFHKAFRDAVKADLANDITHQIIFLSDDPDSVEDVEEALIGNVLNAHPRNLNMIPGGKAGLEYLRANGMLGRKTTSESREASLEDWMRENPRKGIPAPWVSELWKDDAYAASVITGAEGRLSVKQVREIRTLKDLDPEEIAQRVGARNVGQVRRVLSGQSYSRIT